MTEAIHPIPVAWVSSRGSTAAPNYDEFPTDAAVTEYVAAHPACVLAAEMPQCTPAARAAGRDFEASLPEARAHLQHLKESGELERCENVIGLYEIRNPDTDARTLGVTVAIRSDAVAEGTSRQRGIVIRNEDVFPAKVQERRALLEATGHLTSFPNLVPGALDTPLGDRVREAIARHADPTACVRDRHGYEHRLTIETDAEAQEALLAALGGQELYVADGNHRTLAAQLAGVPYFLAVVFCPETVEIQRYNRLVAAGAVDAATWAKLAETLEPAPVDAPTAGAVCVYRAGRWYAIDEPSAHADRLDHAFVEAAICRDALGLDPDDKRLVYVGGSHSLASLAESVDSGEYDLAIAIPPVQVADFIEVNRKRRKMPRKSTWFMPKTLAGLLVGELPG